MQKRFFTLFFLIFFGAVVYGQEEIEVPDEPINKSYSNEVVSGVTIAAEEEFAWGVRAFHEGQYNKSLVNFERALSMNPQVARYKLWTGFANYYAGLDQSAIMQWETVLDDPEEGGAWLKSKIDTLIYRKSPYFNNVEADSWTERGALETNNTRNAHFLRPISVKADPVTGGAYITGYANNSVAKYDVNGNLINQYRGLVVEFDGPYDVLPLADGRFFVSEFFGNRISLVNSKGFRLNTFGSTKEEGGLKGPQFLDCDEEGYLYVSDWGNKRIVKYDFSGQYIMDIGRPSYDFEGLSEPSGLAISPTEIYVAEQSDNVIYVFDHSGNFLREIGRGKFLHPEGLTLYQNRYLVVADGTRVMTVDLTLNTIVQLTDLDGRAKQITQVSFDRNNNLLLVDNQANRFVYLSRLSNLYGGLFVNIQRIYTEEWPKITIEAVVQNRSGDSIIGLKEQNFLVKENGMSPVRRNLELKDFQVGSLDMPFLGKMQGAVIVEGSNSATLSSSLMQQGLKDLYTDIHEKGSLNYFWASTTPIAENVLSVIDAISIYQKRYQQVATDEWRFDMAVRLAANSLFPRIGKQAIFFLNTGVENSAAFAQYKPDELASFLKNNGIAFYPIYIDSKVRSASYDYLASETGGFSSYLYRPEGLGVVVDVARSNPSGVYTITYNSSASKYDQNQFQEVDLEVALQRESGSTRSGYFMPLK